MGYYCCVPLCNSNSKKKNGISFHGFTKDKKIREIWLQNIRRDVNSKSNPFRINHHTKICSLHFLKSDFKIASEKWRLKPTAVPTIFAWTQKNSESNVIKIPTYVPKNSENSDSDNETGNEINENVKMDSDAEKLEVKIEDTDIFEEDLKIDEAPKKNAKEENFSLEEYKTMYQRLLSENNYLKNELENLTYKYKDQGELYDNLVVVNKTTQKENNEFRHTIAILQACLKNTQKQYYLQKTLMNEPNLFLIAKTIQENTLKF